MEKTIYVRMRHRIQVNPNDSVSIGELAQISASPDVVQDLTKEVVYQVNMSDRNIVVLDALKVIDHIRKKFPHLDIQTIGPAQTIIEIIFKKRRFSAVFFVLVWFLLFVGSGLTMMNFHEDVAMKEVHQQIYKLITGQQVTKPLLFQIPYSIGLGLGMVLFFNHIFRKRINEEPSPLEVEMFNYQQDLDNYLIMTENKESLKHVNDD